MILTDVIPAHSIAVWLMTLIDRMLRFIGLEHMYTLHEIVYVVVVVAASITLGWAIRVIIVWSSRKFVRLSHTGLVNEILQSRLISRCSHFITPLVMMSLLPFAFNQGTLLRDICDKLLFIYLLVTIGIGLSAVIEFMWSHYDVHENTRNLPLKGIANTCKGIVWLIVAIIGMSVLVDKSPAALLTGLGAFAAALMLIFKDSILGFVAGIQLSQNDMVHLGDWIVVPGTEVNGIVNDISLTTVKVRNFDNTMVTCPPYMLVQHSFQNWSGIKDFGARRISYNLTVCNDSVIPLSDDLRARLMSRYPALASWAGKVSEAPRSLMFETGLSVVNGTVETNLGLFRAYILLYLQAHPRITQQQQMLARIVDPSSEGTQLNIYCFTDTTDWTLYEAIKSQVLEHFTSVAPDFGLELYTPASLDVDLMGTGGASAPSEASSSKIG